MRKLSQLNLWLSLLADTQIFRVVPHIPDDNSDYMIFNSLVFFLLTSIVQHLNEIKVTELKCAHVCIAVSLETTWDITCTEKQKKKAVVTDIAQCAKITDLCKQMQIMRTVAKMRKHQRGVSTEKMRCHPHMLYVIYAVALRGGAQQREGGHNSKP